MVTRDHELFHANNQPSNVFENKAQTEQRSLIYYNPAFSFLVIIGDDRDIEA